MEVAKRKQMLNEDPTSYGVAGLFDGVVIRAKRNDMEVPRKRPINASRTCIGEISVASTQLMNNHLA